ncbi:MAG TPA: hypothetical protein VNF07_09745 [Acidimicrobiales bacterium]|nr:hypothetical protein [Acidimicrobiales bacterium]
MEEERPFLDELLDVALYAPVGLALTVLEDLPGLIDKGRRRVAGQVGAAKLVGRFALRNARRRLDDLLEPSGTDATVTVLHRDDRAEPPAAPPVTPAVAVSSEHLAIPGYDALAASQVVARLEALTAAELDAVEQYELATRRRRTILNRVTQLRG